MKIALSQMNSVTGDLEGNLSKIVSEIKTAKANKTELIIFPEMAITGYCISDLVEDDLFIFKNKEILNEITKESKDISIIVGFIDYDENKKNNDGRMKKFNAAALLSNGEIVGIVHKTLLPNYRYFDEKRYFSPGEEIKVLELKLKNKVTKLGISICEDMWDDSYNIKPVRELAKLGAEIIININASPFYFEHVLERKEVIKNHVNQIKIPFIYVNTIGAADNGKNIIPFDGNSLVYDYEGNLILAGKKFQEDLIFFDTEKKYEAIRDKVSNKDEEMFNALVMSLKDYALQAGFKKAIVPVSGGIDSALGLVIAVEAFGNENVTSYNLPSKFNTTATKNIAQKLSENLKVEYKIIPIQEIDNKIRNIFIENAHEIKSKVAKENIHARVRGILMMLESNDENSLLISNGNKTEIALGYSTLYGDMCGGISVIGDLSKTAVYKLSKYVNKKHNKEIIPNEVFTIKPSAELSEGQYDPFDYEVVSPIVELFVEERDSALGIVNKFKNRTLDERFDINIYNKYDLEGFSKIVYEIYNLLRRSVYKRLQGPPIIAITKRSFGFDLRETLINKWSGK